MATRQTIYTFHIDLDERGYFMAHVENSRGNTIVSYDLPTYSELCVECGNSENNCTCEEFVQDNEPEWDILDDSWGIMKHNRDVEGLEKHYKECGMMPKNATLVLAE